MAADEELPKLLSRFATSAERLNKASDAVNLILAKVEKRLAERNAGVEYWLRHALNSSDAEGSTRGETSWTAKVLGFAKVNGTWCLAAKPVRYVSGFFEGDTSCPYQNEYKAGEPIPLLKAPRDIRISALSLLPNLVQEMTEAAEACVKTIDEAKQFAQ